MTFNTGNNVPSTSPRDLYDNAENLDKLVNGAEPFYPDRLGKMRESWAGMENSFTNAQEGRETAFELSQSDKEDRFQAFLVSSGYVSKGDYAADVILAERNEYVAVDAATTGTSPGLYRPNPSAVLPLTLTGTWATDSASLVLLGDDVLRQELAAGETILVGGGAVGFVAGEGATLRTAYDKLLEQAVTPEDFGAVGDGVTVDADAFAKMNARLVVMGGGHVVLRKTYNLPDGWELPVSGVSVYGMGIGEIKCSGKVSDAIGAYQKNNLLVDGVKITIPRTGLRADKFCILFNECNNIRIKDVRTDGGVAGAWMQSCNDVLVTDCYIDTPKADGIHFGQGSKRCKALNNTVINAGDDAFSTTFYTGGAGRPTDISFIGNTVVGTLWGFGVAGYGVDRCIIANNNITGTALGGVILTDHDGSDDPTDSLVIGNRISDACRAETIPYSYWEGTDPALDPPVVSGIHKSAISVQGANISVKGNHVHQVASWPNSNTRRGLTVNGSTKTSITDNSFTDVNGVGIHTGELSNNQLMITGNTFESVFEVGIMAVSPVTTSLSICGNTAGFGSVGDEPFFIYLQNAGTTKVVMAGNNSSNGRGYFIDGSSTNVLTGSNLS